MRIGDLGFGISDCGFKRIESCKLQVSDCWFFN
jgi:hypothetical protein